MRSHHERSACMPMCIAGLSFCMLAVLGIVAVARSIPASYAGMPDGGARPTYGSIAGGSLDASGPASRRRRACPECGIIESIRRIERYGDVAGDAGSGRTMAEKDFEITVRFRDGRTAVFNEATPRSWRSGGRVIVIAGS
jgi:hypothetical protein